jgi:hypothetical protein
MGYDVHVTRSENWWEAETKQISLEEWLEYCRTDSELRVDGYAEATSPAGETIRYENPGLAVWTGKESPGGQNEMVWFDWQGGCVVVKYPDGETFKKMFQIAVALGARVQGDDGEFYDENGEPSTGSDSSAPKPLPWWKRILGIKFE